MDSKTTTNNHLNIRYANIKDAKAMAAIHIRSWQTAYQGIVPDDILDNLNIEKRQLHFETSMPNYSSSQKM